DPLRHHARRARRDRGALPRAALWPAADAAPGAERRGAGDRRGDRGVRPAARHHRGRGLGRRDVLHDVQAAAGRRLPRRGVHEHAVRGHGRRRDHGAAAGPPRRRQRRDDRRRRDHPRARRVQRGLRLRPGGHGQLGVHGPHDAHVGDPAGRRPARRHGGPLHARTPHLHLAGGRAGARRLQRRPGRRGPGCRTGDARRPGARPREGLASAGPRHHAAACREGQPM
ncbi:MAG: NADH-ubiquinone oxidoreductase chain E, partial [uncultured Nocardioidaceae bacterium]